MVKFEQPIQYIVAVSGGVDSVVLLDMLATGALELSGGLLVAHFDHGMRPDSASDRLFVGELAARYGLPFEYAEGKLGGQASEARARQVRYAFLRELQTQYGARSIVTAHHEDDVLETALLNIMRGTGRRGLSSLKSTDDIRRPLLTTSKAKLIEYAREHNLTWREDSTNKDISYRRNYVRHEILSRFDAEARLQLRQLLVDAHRRNAEIDNLLADQLKAARVQSEDRLDRSWFIMLPHNVSREIMAAWLRRLGILNFDRKLLERVSIAAKTAVAGKQLDINGHWIILVGKNDLVLAPRKL